MREADRKEVWASHRLTPTDALTGSLERSALAWTCLIHGVPAFMFGVSDTGTPWLLGTNLFFKQHRALHREFLRQNQEYIDLMLERFPRLENHIHADNRLSIRWLRHCGFLIEKDPVLFNGEEFYRFWMDTHPRPVMVRQITVTEAFEHQMFPSLAREYAEESAIAGLPDPQGKLGAYQMLESSGSEAFAAYGAFWGDTLIGFVVVLTPVIPHYGVAIAVAESLFVGRSYRKLGAGMMLIRQAEQRAREVRSPGLLLSAPSGGRLERILPRRGYLETNRVFMKGFSYE